MRSCSPKRLWLALLLLSVAAGGARGQWRIVAPNAVTSGTEWNGAMHYRDGVIWAGLKDLIFSIDTGRTWTKTNLGVGSEILDISFLNQDTGIVVSNSGAFLTLDQGRSWTNVYSFSALGTGWRRVIYDPHSHSIYAVQLNPCSIFSSSDGGNSWTSQVMNASRGLSLTIGIDGTFYFLGDGEVFASRDNGLTWGSASSQTEFDSYSIDVDSCDVNTLYVANEDFVDPSLPSQLFTSRDLGNTWEVNFSHYSQYLSGAFASGPHSQYATSDWDGIIRSTDKGTTLINIGGPAHVLFDARNICTVNDNIVFVLDSGGNIWATFNSGGDSILESSFSPKLSTLPDSVFTSDTIQCDSITRSVVFSKSGCTPPSVTGVVITGDDSASFHASDLTSDSILVTLSGINQGNQHAQLVLFLDNGSSDTVSLAGYVNTGANVLTLSTQNAQTDTLGATVAVPITLNGLEHAENVTLVMHYDGSVDYLGSFSPSGVQLDVPGQQWAGRSELSITGATSGAVMGYAKFNVFNDSNTAAHATFDSVNVLTQTSACEYSMPAPATSTITTLSGCAIPILSQLIHLGVEPILSVVPNPANGNVWLSSNTDLGDVTIEIYDMLGIQQSEVLGQISENNPIELLLPARSGVYNILVRSIVGTRTLRVVREN
jgi:photosystem II stability/assembly factor-like uncharacterized protein